MSHKGLASKPEVNYERLSMFLKALSNPNRLELLDKLRFPHAVGDINLTPKRTEAEGNPNRPISRQAVEEHLKVLQAIGVITTQRATREGRSVDEYVVSHPTLFAVTEELRKLSLIRAHAPVEVYETRTSADPMDAKGNGFDLGGPRLCVVSGVFEGKTYPLRRKDLEEERGWIIGRREGIAVSLDYDPFVSAENTEVLLRDNAFVALDLRGNRNGTIVNWAPLPKGGERVLSNGDLIGVGRSLLLFRSD